MDRRVHQPESPKQGKIKTSILMLIGWERLHERRYEMHLDETTERSAHRGEYNDLAKTVRHLHHDDVLAGCGKTIVARGRNSMARASGAMGNALQDAQEGRPARPQRVKGRGVPSGVR